ncbi:uncharacterized protein LOC127284844 isoform X2 [Leptopilina boulardi]|nr:uncharacterized protein LOC127284844 isoform X2 [Leptopilina boulardi]
MILEKMELNVNDKIGICSENNINVAITIFASIFKGTTICPYNPLYTEQELIHVLNISMPKFIFISKSVCGKMEKLVKKLSWTVKLILLNEDDNSKIPNLSNLIANISNDELSKFQLPKIEKNEHISIIASSSGTTGLSKGVMLMDKNILLMIQTQTECLEPVMKNKMIVSGFMPLFHIYALDILLFTVACNSKMIIFPKFEERSFLQAVEKYKIQIVCLVPTILIIFSTSSIIHEYDLSSVKRIVTAAAPLPPKIGETAKKHFPNSELYICYGMTETCFATTFALAENDLKSVGVLQPGYQAKVIALTDDSKEPLGPNCEGELCFKGENIMKGYYGDEKATRASIDEEGFLHTGDVGYYNEKGYFYIVDRVKELIKYKGFQVPPAELEAILFTHPAIQDAAVVGLPDEFGEELPLAFVVKKPDVNVSSIEIIQYVNEAVSPQKKLRGGVRFIEAIPRSSAGKILRKDLRNILVSIKD